jgi:hypothetical protein
MNRIWTGALAALLLAGCKTIGFDGRAAAKDPAADQAQSELAGLQADPDLASRAPAAIKEAQDAVSAAEVPQSDPVLASHLAYMAERKVQIARALAESRQAEDQLDSLRAQRATQPAAVTIAPNGAPVVQLPPGGTVPLNPDVPTVPSDSGTAPAWVPSPAPTVTVEPQAPPPPPPTVTVPGTTPSVNTRSNAPVVPLPDTQPAPGQQQGN